MNASKKKKKDRRKTPSFEDLFIFLHSLASGFLLSTHHPLLATGLLSKPSESCGWHCVLEDSALLTSPCVTLGEVLRVSRREGETDGQKWVLLCVQGRYMGRGMRSWGGLQGTWL